jgi:DNA modification methylase
MNRQHRDIAFFGVLPDFKKVRQPYREDSAKTRRLLAQGTGGAKIYDWWEVNQVKNVSKEKTGHPCQMPIEVMRRLVGILPDDATIIDPFMGSGTTGVACRMFNKKFVGIEMNDEYFNIAKGRICGS